MNDQYLIIETVPLSMRHPAWRWNAALHFMVDPDITVTRAYEDAYLLEAINFYRTRGDIMVKPYVYAARHPAMYEAFLVNCDSKLYGGYKWHLEAMLMTDADDEEIAKHMNLSTGADTVALYRKVYFDIDAYRDKPVCLHANLMAAALSRQATEEDCDFTWKAFANEWGLDGFLNLVDFRMGKKLPKKMRTWFDDVTQDRLSYGSYQVTSTTRQMYTEQAMNVVNAAMTNWRIDSNKVLPGAGSEDLAAKQFLNTIQMVMIDPNLERRIENNTSAIEPRLRYNYDLLESE